MRKKYTGVLGDHSLDNGLSPIRHEAIILDNADLW